VIGIILPLVVAFKMFKSVWGGVMGGLNLLKAHPVFAALALLAILAVTIYDNWEPIKDFFAKLWSNDLVKQIAIIVAAIGGIVGIIKAWTAAQWLLNAAMSANPFVFIAAVIIAALVAVWYYWDGICAIFSAGIEKIKGWFSDAGAWISEKWQALKNAFTLENAANAFMPLIDWFMVPVNFIKDKWQALKDAFTFENVANCFLSLIEWFMTPVNFIEGKWEALKNAFTLENIANAFMPLIDWFMTPVNYIKEKWKELTESFSLDGLIENMSAKVQEFINSIAGWIPDWVKKFFGFETSSPVPPNLEASLETPATAAAAASPPPNDLPTSMGGQRALLEEVGYKFDDKGKIVEEPQGSQEEISARYAEAKRRRESMPAAEPLAQQSQNQATATAQATTNALSTTPLNAEVKNEVKVKVDPTTITLEVDGDAIAEKVIEHVHSEEVRNGSAE
jgi:hypothetical protein